MTQVAPLDGEETSLEVVRRPSLEPVDALGSIVRRHSIETRPGSPTRQELSAELAALPHVVAPGEGVVFHARSRIRTHVTFARCCCGGAGPDDIEHETAFETVTLTNRRLIVKRVVSDRAFQEALLKGHRRVTCLMRDNPCDCMCGPQEHLASQHSTQYETLFLDAVTGLRSDTADVPVKESGPVDPLRSCWTGYWWCSCCTCPWCDGCTPCCVPQDVHVIHEHLDSFEVMSAAGSVVRVTVPSTRAVEARLELIKAVSRAKGGPPAMVMQRAEPIVKEKKKKT